MEVLGAEEPKPPTVPKLEPNEAEVEPKRPVDGVEE
jgi:hypothetical protein